MGKIDLIKSQVTIDDVLSRLPGCESPKKPNAPFRCPFPENHKNNDQTPSCVMWPNRKGIKCFSCHYKDNAFNLVRDRNNLTPSETIKWFEENFPALRYTSLYERSAVSSHGTELVQEDLKPLDASRLRRGTRHQIDELSQRLELGDVGLNLAARDGVLRFYTDFSGNLRWAVLGIVDGKVYVTQERRVDGQPIALKDGTEVKCRTIGKASIPISPPSGLAKNVILCEGATDLLAAYQLSWCEGVTEIFSPVAMLGASNRIPHFFLERFRGRNVIIFPDNDIAGMNGCDRWKDQLEPYADCVKVFDFGNLKTDEGKQINDLCDFMRINVDDWENDPEARSPLSSFLASKGVNYV